MCGKYGQIKIRRLDKKWGADTEQNEREVMQDIRNEQEVQVARGIG
jgi:hypothetical protein